MTSAFEQHILKESGPAPTGTEKAIWMLDNIWNRGDVPTWAKFAIKSTIGGEPTSKIRWQWMSEDRRLQDECLCLIQVKGESHSPDITYRWFDGANFPGSIADSLSARPIKKIA